MKNYGKRIVRGCLLCDLRGQHVIKLISGQVVDAMRPFVSDHEMARLISDDNVGPVDKLGEDSRAAFHRVEIYLSNKC